MMHLRKITPKKKSSHREETPEHKPIELFENALKHIERNKIKILLRSERICAIMIAAKPDCG